MNHPLQLFFCFLVNLSASVPNLLRAGLIASVGIVPSFAAEHPVEVLDLSPTAANPRNSEGDFIQLQDGRLLFIYTHFTGGHGDESTAHLASRVSHDGGLTWSQNDKVEVPNEGTENIMSVSLLRLQNNRIALLYARKNSLFDCRPYLRFSDDEAATWSEPVEVIPESEIGYYVVNNDRLVQLSDGRLLVPNSLHLNSKEDGFSGHGIMICYYSDDDGQHWTRSTIELDGRPLPGASVSRILLQEPGVVQRTDGSLLMFIRTDSGAQYFSTSHDGGDTWTRPWASPLLSPRSPASIERNPATGNLIAVWNDHQNIPAGLQLKRTPLSIAVSTDDGATWSTSQTLFDSPSGWYCYTAMEWLGDHTLLLGHCSGDRSKNNGLARSQITRVPLSWIDE